MSWSNLGYAASRGIAKVMQHLQKIDEASAAKFLLVA